MTFDLYNNGAELMNSRVNTYEYPAELAKDFEIEIWYTVNHIGNGWP